jgi:thiamine transport system substrate-binding protein
VKSKASFLVITKGFFMKRQSSYQQSAISNHLLTYWTSSGQAIRSNVDRRKEVGETLFFSGSPTPLLPFLMLFAFLLLTSAFAQKLTVLTHDSFAMSQDVMDTFTAQTGINVTFIQAGDAGEVVNRAILTKARPLADVLYGIDNSLLARALNEDIFIPYQSPELANVSERYQFDPQHFVTPIDVGYVNFNLDDAYFAENNLPPPTDISQLTDATYKSLTVVANPTTSSPGLAFMLATIAHFGETGDYTWLHYWADLRDNDISVVAGWNEAYYTSFTRYGGDRPIVLSYATSPAAEVMFSETPIDKSPTSNLLCQQCAFEQIEAAGILKGTKNQAAAQTFIDFMLSQEFQNDIAPNMFVYPVVEGSTLPEAFSFSSVPTLEQTAALPSETVESNLKTWLKAWTEVVEQGQNPSEVLSQ